jgi:hypothetical protein
MIRARTFNTWAALSVRLLLILINTLLIFDPPHVLEGLVLLAVVFVLLESIFRGTFTSTITTVAIVLALIASGGVDHHVLVADTGGSVSGRRNLSLVGECPRFDRLTTRTTKACA